VARGWQEPGGARPLEGIVVLDFTRVLSGPHATRILADLGADVVKVEPPTGDLTRFTAPRVNSTSTYFAQQNAGKRNVSIDVTRPEGADVVRRIALRCDAVVENFRHGVMDRLGLDWASLSAANPRLVYASITGYGSDGPWTDRRAFAPTVGAESGITRSQGDARGGSYANDPHSHADVYTGVHAALAVVAALFQRERTGTGQHLDVSMAEVMLYDNEHAHDQLWRAPVPPGTIRSFRPGDYPVLTAADGSRFVVSGHPAERGTFELYLAAVGRGDLAADPRFADPADRLAHLPDLMAVLAQWAATMPSAAAAEDVLAAHGLASGALRSARELADTEWSAARGATVHIDDRGSGTIQLPNSPWHFSRSDTSLRGPVRYRGEDNRDVLVRLAGLSDADVDRLERDGVLSSRVPAPGA